MKSKHRICIVQSNNLGQIVLLFTANLEEVAGVAEIMRTIERLTNLEQHDRIKAENQFLEEISSYTGKLYSCLHFQCKNYVVQICPITFMHLFN